MPETEPADSSTELKPSRLEFWFLRRIRLWIVGLIVLVLVTGAVSFWWPMYRAGKIIERVEAKFGAVEMRFEHPNWLFWIGEETYHPWFDTAHMLFPNVPLSDSFLDELRIFSEVELIVIETQNLSSDALRSLSEFRELEILMLSGNGNRCPLDWAASLPKLEVLGLKNVSVSEDDWKSIASPRSKIDSLIIEDMNLSAISGKSISSIPRLEWLSLMRCRMTPGFWENLATSSTLSRVEVLDTALESVDLQKLEKLPNLKFLEVSRSQIAPEDLQRFEETRSDVDIIFSEEPSLVE